MTGVSGKFAVAPPCFKVELEIDLSNEYYLGEVYWEFENSASTTKFTDQAGADLEGIEAITDQSNVMKNTVDMTNINDGQYDNFGVWAGTYMSKGIYTYRACFDPGTYTFTGRDSYGDGWNGGKFSIKDVDSGMYLAKSSGGGNLKSQGVRYDLLALLPDYALSTILTMLASLVDSLVVAEARNPSLST